MAWHALYETDTGRLVSVGQVVADPVPAGLSVAELPARPADSEMWDEASRAFVARPAKVLIDRLDDLQNHPSFADLRQAMASLSPAERTAIRQAIGRLIARYRYRNASESPEAL